MMVVPLDIDAQPKKIDGAGAGTKRSSFSSLTVRGKRKIVKWIRGDRSC